MGRTTSLALAFLPRLKPMLSLSEEDCCALESFAFWAARGSAAASTTKKSAARRARWLCRPTYTGEVVNRVSRLVSREIFILSSMCEQLYIREGARECSIGGAWGWPVRIREIV